MALLFEGAPLRSLRVEEHHAQIMKNILILYEEDSGKAISLRKS